MMVLAMSSFLPYSTYPPQHLLYILSQIQVDLIRAQQLGNHQNSDAGRNYKISNTLKRIDQFKQRYMPPIHQQDWLGSNLKIPDFQNSKRMYD